ncbi:MAG: 2'-5' RNA ligase family protein [Oscillospiraceae bacterium]
MRCGFLLPLPFRNKIKDRLKAGMDGLRSQGVRASWSRRENLHLTLEFLGELDSAKEAIAAMEQVQAAPFRLEFAPSGRFRRREGIFSGWAFNPMKG